MVLEVADIAVIPGSEEAFVKAYHSVRDLVLTTPGCQWVRMTQSVETPSRFVLMVQWESVEAHVVNFRDTQRWVDWRAAIGPHFARPPHVEHVVDV